MVNTENTLICAKFAKTLKYPNLLDFTQISLNHVICSSHQRFASNRKMDLIEDEVALLCVFVV